MSTIRVGIMARNSGWIPRLRELLAQAGDFEVLILDPAAAPGLSAEGIPDIFVILAEAPEEGLRAFPDLLAPFPGSRATLVAEDPETARQGLEAGAKGCVLLPEIAQLPAMLREVHAGRVVIPSAVGENLLRRLRDQERRLAQVRFTGLLSEREREILLLHGRGLSRREMAQHLCISFYTVRRHLQNALDKTGMARVRDLVEALREG